MPFWALICIDGYMAADEIDIYIYTYAFFKNAETYLGRYTGFTATSNTWFFTRTHIHPRALHLSLPPSLSVSPSPPLHLHLSLSPSPSLSPRASNSPSKEEAASSSGTAWSCRPEASLEEPEPVLWELYIPQDHLEGTPGPSDCSVRAVRVLEGGFLSSSSEQGSMSEGRPVLSPQLCKAEPTFTKDIETFLSSLTSPLQVVHAVDPAEVALNPRPWIPAIGKEVGAVEHAVVRLRPSDPRQAIT